jgi:hypothetical protein
MKEKIAHNLLANESNCFKGCALEVDIAGVVRHVVQKNGNQIVPLAMRKIKCSNGSNNLINGGKHRIISEKPGKKEARKKQERRNT